MGITPNLDLFAVIIDSLPIINGNRLTAKQLFDHFRKNINDFATKFDPYSDPYDKILWESENPLGAVITITMKDYKITPFVDADGDVIVSQYEECCWIFTTLRGPVYESGYHPVSGNRQFGYVVQNGKTIIYTKGADRTTNWYHGLNDSQIAFESADELWRGMQEKMKQYVRVNAGKISAMETYEFTFRPNWSDVKEILMSNYPITNIPCH